jgi:outer membrane protein assembly factor BamB
MLMAETHVTAPPPPLSLRAPLAPPPSPSLRRFLLPAFLVLFVVFAAYVPWLWVKFDLDPGPIMWVYMGSLLAMVLGVLGLAVWLLFFSRLLWRTRLLAFAAVYVLPPAVLAVIVREVEFTGNVRPRFFFIWERDHKAEAKRHIAEQRARSKTDLPTRDPTVDPAGDSPRYRGVAADGQVRGARLRAEDGLETVWKQPCGGGHVGFAVAGNMLVTVEQRDDQEAVVCYDRATGRQCWEHVYDARFKQTENMGGDGPRATPAIAGGDVYSVGALGHLVCLDAVTGERRWGVNIIDDNEAEVPRWGVTGSPLVVDDKVIVCAGVKPSANAGKSLAAYDRKTGKRVWANGDKPAGYSSPMLVTLAGRRQVLMFDGGGLAGFDPDSGRELWRHEWLSFNEMNIIQPVLCGDDRVFIASDPKSGGAMLRVLPDGSGYRAEVVWKNRSLCAGYCNPVLYDGHLYGLSTGVLVCLDVSTGKRVWRGGEFGNGQILLLGDVLLITAEDEGDVALVRATPDGFRPLSRTKLFDRRTWNVPAVAGGRLYVRNHVEMACLRLPLAE